MKKSKVFSIIVRAFILFTGFAILFSGTASADSSLDVEVNSDQFSINFDWSDVSKKYSLYLLDEEGKENYLWKGESANYTHDKLKANTSYKYKLYAYNAQDEEVYSVIINSRTLKTEKQIKSLKKANISTLKNENKIYFPMSQNTINTFYSKDNLTLSWKGIPTDDNEYKIYKDGEYITKVKELEYTDHDIEENEVYKYSVEGNKKLPGEEIERRKKEAKNELGRSLSEEEEKTMFFEKKTSSIIARTSNQTAFKTELEYEESSKTKSKNNYFEPPSGRNMMLRYTTFIPLDYAENPWPSIVKSNAYFIIESLSDSDSF